MLGSTRLDKAHDDASRRGDGDSAPPMTAQSTTRVDNGATLAQRRYS